MKRLFTLISAILACFLCVILSIQMCEAKTVLYLRECGTVLDVFKSKNDENIYILSDYNNNYKVTKIDDNFNRSEIALDIDVNNSTYAYSNDTFYFFNNDMDIDNSNFLYYTNINSYNCITEERRRKVINYAESELYGTFAVDSDENYYLISNGGIDVYTSKCKYSKTIPTESQPLNLTNSDDGRIVFCTSHDDLIILYNNEKYYYNISADKIFSGNNGYFATDRGNVYRFDNGVMSEIYNYFNGNNGFASVGKRIFGNKNGVLTAIYADNENETSVGEINTNTYICSLGDSCCCITQNGGGADVELFTEEDVNINEHIDTIIDSESSESTSIISKNISSNIYNIDRSSNTIKGIMPESTVATLKNNIKGGTLKFYDNKGNVKTSGKVGTGMIVENTDTGEHFSIIIYGELSGEGNINSSDKKILVNHLLGKKNLDEIYFEAADINNDSQVNLKDYVAIDNYLKGKYNIEQKR